MQRFFFLVLSVLLLAATIAPTRAHAALKVVATIKPIHSLAASIMEGVAEPRLLLEGAASPHTYALKPSDVAMLNTADIIVRVSPNLEVFLEKALRSLSPAVRVINLQQAPGLSLLPVRAHGHDSHGEDSGDADSIDVHFWLDAGNARAIARFLEGELAAADPEHAAIYHANADRLDTQLGALDAELKERLGGLAGLPFFVFHDVTQYLERRYGLSGLGAITPSPEREPGVRRLEAIRAEIARAKAICLFSEPEFPPKLIGMLKSGTGAKTGVLDEIGATLPAGKNQYFELMRGNAESLAACLKT